MNGLIDDDVFQKKIRKQNQFIFTFTLTYGGRRY